MISKRYPYGKKKAFNVTYDDGVTQDIRFVSLLNRYGLKGTFNLNSGMAENEFQWTHECGLVVKRLKTEALAPLYAGHEVASHTLSHPNERPAFRHQKSLFRSRCVLWKYQFCFLALITQ